MKREVLFRIKDHDDWYYGYPLNEISENNIVSFQGKDKNGGTYFNALADATTLTEFTNLTDINGKKIFEGDIIKVVTKDTHEERFIEVCVGEFTDDSSGDLFIGVYLKYDGYTVSAGQIKEFGSSGVEVVGNIHDNPELLKSNAILP